MNKVRQTKNKSLSKAPHQINYPLGKKKTLQPGHKQLQDKIYAQQIVAVAKSRNKKLEAVKNSVNKTVRIRSSNESKSFRPEGGRK